MILCRIYEGLKPALLVGDLCMVRQVLVKDFHKFSSRRVSNGAVTQLTRVTTCSSIQVDNDGGSDAGANFLFALKHKAWMRVRTLIGPSFSAGQIKTMQNLIQESLDFLIHNMEVTAINGYPIDVKKYFGAFALDVVASCALGQKVNSLQDPEHMIVKNTKRIINSKAPLSSLLALIMPLLGKSFSLKPFDCAALAQLKAVLADTIKARRNDAQSQRHDFIKLLLDATEEKRGSLTDDELIDQCLMFIMTGYEATSAALTSIAYCLATNPECQERLLSEVDLVNVDEVDFDTLQTLPYLDAFICETFRIMPPVSR